MMQRGWLLSLQAEVTLKSKAEMISWHIVAQAFLIVSALRKSFEDAAFTGERQELCRQNKKQKD